MKTRILLALVLTLVVGLGIASMASAVSGAAFTTYNPWVDGAFRDICKNSIINCNIYGAKQDVWLNGGPSANGLGPDGEYFFAVLVPGGQPDPNDGGAKNLSDDYDLYTDRQFTVTDGEVSFYGGPHDLDSGNFLDAGRKYCNKPRGCTPDGKEPLIRLYPYADTWNPGGVYILAICSLDRGYPVEPRDCKYDAFKVKDGPVSISFFLSGMKFEDLYADGVNDAGDPGLAGWTITIKGTGFLGEPIDETVTTGAGGYWSYQKDYSYSKTTAIYNAVLTICEVQQYGWNQSYPGPGACHVVTIEPASLAEVPGLDFGNWRPVDVTICKARDLDGEPGGETVPVKNWSVILTKEGVVVDTQLTGENGCYTWTGLTPGFAYDAHEGSEQGWEALGPVDFVFDRAKSGDSFSHTFVNAVLQGCTPGFWQGGSNNDGQAGGAWIWNEVNDPDWVASGGAGTNPYVWTTDFNSFFTPYAGLATFDMMSLVGTGGGSDDFQKAARDLVAAYLNASWGMNYPFSTAQLSQMWAAAVGSGDFMALHLVLDAANNSGADVDRDGDLDHQCPISASGY